MPAAAVRGGPVRPAVSPVAPPVGAAARAVAGPQLLGHAERPEGKQPNKCIPASRPFHGQASANELSVVGAGLVTVGPGCDKAGQMGRVLWTRVVSRTDRRESRRSARPVTPRSTHTRGLPEWGKPLRFRHSLTSPRSPARTRCSNAICWLSVLALGSRPVRTTKGSMA